MENERIVYNDSILSAYLDARLKSLAVILEQSLERSITLSIVFKRSDDNKICGNIFIINEDNSKTPIFDVIEEPRIIILEFIEHLTSVVSSFNTFANILNKQNSRPDWSFIVKR